MGLIEIQVIRKGVLPEKITQTLNTIMVSAEHALEVLAEKTRDKMKENIETTTYRKDGNSGNLSESITAEKIEGGWGVGNIPHMNEKAPYWYLMNYGGMSTIAARGLTLYGSFGPGNSPDHRYAGSNPGAGTEIFVQNSFPSFPMKPKNPISPKNYIENTANWASTVWGVMLSEGIDKAELLIY